MAPKSFLLALLAFGSSTLLPFASARTDLEGCISTATTNQWGHASMLWYVPGTGEICDFPDCGGGRAPPKTTVPGCPLYSGTATITPSYIKLSTSTPASRTRTTASPSGGEDSSDPVITSPPPAGQTTTDAVVSVEPTESGEEGGSGVTATGTASGSTGAPVSTPLSDAAAGMGVAGSIMAGIIAVAGLVVL